MFSRIGSRESYGGRITMRNEKRIIGVVGPTRAMRKMDKETAATIVNLAQEVGRKITNKQHVILTGGKPKPSQPEKPQPVKSAAMYGAQQESTKHPPPARLISVLREFPKFDVCLHEDSNPPCKHLFIKTTWKDERNFINGCVPDALIAIHGGCGTLSEIAFANALGTPIVFLQTPELDTIDVLKKVMEKQLESFHDILKSVHQEFPFFDVAKLDKETKTLLNESPETPLNIAHSCEQAVENAKSLADQRMMRSFNNLPYHHDFIGKLDLYEKHLNSLMEG